MVLHTGAVADKMANTFTCWGPFRLLGNPFIAAMLVTVIAMIVLFKVLDRGGHFSKLPWVTKARGILLLFLGASAIFSLHYYALERDMSEAYGVGSQDDLVTELHAAQAMPQELGVQSGDHIPIATFREHARIDGAHTASHTQPPPAVHVPPIAQYVGQGEPDPLSLRPLAMRPLGQ